ncbi:MAG: Rieske (2Fe-2S) protein [Candidatus Omnitrophica bacterium]|nr:Rieske (2Fe-2S) protein [Candidatus Omnitrophota bacterium]
MSEAFQSFNPGDKIAGHEDLAFGESKVVMVCVQGHEVEAILVKTEEGYLSYVNRCRHLAVPLDWGDGDVLDESGNLFLCRTHGALFRLKDGFCVSGPCQGQSLFAVPIAVEKDGIYLAEPDSAN